jgi:hypothetical protein
MFDAVSHTIPRPKAGTNLQIRSLSTDHAKYLPFAWNMNVGLSTVAGPMTVMCARSPPPSIVSSSSI